MLDPKVNFKLAVISCLIQLGVDFSEAEQIRSKAYGTRIFDKLGYDEVLDDVLSYYNNLNLDALDLQKITHFNPTLSSSCYTNIVKEWSGEDDIFNLKTVSGIELLPNLKEFCPFGMLEFDVDISALLLCKRLKIVHSEFIPSNSSTNSVLRELEQRGVVIAF